MSEKIIIIGSSGAIGKAFVKFYEEQNSSNIIYSFSRSNKQIDNGNTINSYIDLENDDSITEASEFCKKEDYFDKIIITTGILHEGDLSPEKTFRNINSMSMSKVFSVNTIGPSMIAKNFIPLLNKEKKSFMGFLSARVGSISDNRIGGWYSYRASKSALNMIIKSLSIEVARNNPNAIIAGLHPGTVDSNLSNPFQKNVKEGKLFSPDYSISKMADVINGLTHQNSGDCFAWDGQKIEF